MWYRSISYLATRTHNLKSRQESFKKRHTSVLKIRELVNRKDTITQVKNSILLDKAITMTEQGNKYDTEYSILETDDSILQSECIAVATSEPQPPPPGAPIGGLWYVPTINEVIEMLLLPLSTAMQ